MAALFCVIVSLVFITFIILFFFSFLLFLCLFDLIWFDFPATNVSSHIIQQYKPKLTLFSPLDFWHQYYVDISLIMWQIASCFSVLGCDLKCCSMLKISSMVTGNPSAFIERSSCLFCVSAFRQQLPDSLLINQSKCNANTLSKSRSFVSGINLNALGVLQQ